MAAPGSDPPADPAARYGILAMLMPEHPITRSIVERRTFRKNRGRGGSERHGCCRPVQCLDDRGPYPRAIRSVWLRSVPEIALPKPP